MTNLKQRECQASDDEHRPDPHLQISEGQQRERNPIKGGNRDSDYEINTPRSYTGSDVRIRVSILDAHILAI